ncbi:integration host factor subunit alpha [Acidithiobacillus ferrooxidans]|uniref:Integration host factor subunit alpha n=1 Tax=Acidithiobacillus ferrooxidans TaxID=920 RepID=A0A2W1K653_ACIFR|nr:integration host factor subunit alpha [Acidithiobacillus ferrooxidans]MBU2819399.1 integration host factor subunit alpha [Acidithiobacillus ferrooxidans]MCR1344064.1 integration host factor subunit alpha [Acidithiobacillus ferrooxidans]PZD82438.1 integration host factor subunit alpha [Acidithiobacillus ferrooxidans]QLK41288.1 integration host factor subunit alpha [Acidithiobacillus ferrooxidans]QZT53229.1 integration host factor subunit alpha [Acidithiobacillus ferrooxidans]
MTVTKMDLMHYVTDKVGLPQKDCKQLVEAFFDTVRETLASGENMLLSGFGNFTLRDKPARLGRNPRTGVPSEIRARRVVTFHASQILRARCNPGLPPQRRKTGNLTEGC